MRTMQARIIHTSIARDWRDVAAFLLDPENMAKWAAGLGDGLKKKGDHWIADGGPLGEVEVRFAPANEFGVADHEVTMPDGAKVQNALRVVPNGDGAEVMFTLLRLPDMSDDAFEADRAHVEKDLDTLKALLEGQA